MNIKNFNIVKNSNDPLDYTIFGDIVDDQDNILATFGEHGTSFKDWWLSKSDMHKEDFIMQKAWEIAYELVKAG